MLSLLVPEPLQTHECDNLIVKYNAGIKQTSPKGYWDIPLHAVSCRDALKLSAIFSCLPQLDTTY